MGADQRLILPASLRQYAAEQLRVSAEEPQVMQRHAQVMLQNVRDQTAALRGADQRATLHMVHRELPDIEAAWHWAVAQRDGNLLREAAPALFHVCDIPSDFVRGASLFGAAHTSLEPEREADTAVTWGMVASRYAWFRWHQGAQQEAVLLLEQARDVLAPRDTAAVVFAHNYLGAMAMHRQEAEQAITHCAAALAAAQHVGDRYGEAVASNIRAQVALEQDDLAAAQAWARQSFVLNQQLGNRWSSAYSLTTLGRIALVAGKLHEARRYLAGALDIRQELGDQRGQALCLGFLGDTLLQMEARAQAADAYRAALARYRDLGNDRGVADIIARMVQCGARDAGQESTLALIHDGLHAALRAGPPAAELARVLLAAAPLLREMDPVLANDVVAVSKSRSTSWYYYSSQAWRVLAQTVLATS
jgi:tetratricopeptide (TPR) repeat protein